MTVFFLIPTYNEEQNIELLSLNLCKILPDSKKFYIFVDDCSTDKTIEAINHFFSNTETTIIQKQKNEGPGDSFNKGFNWIIENSTDQEDIIVTIEADNTSDLNILNSMVVISKLGYDVVLASVYAQGGGFDNTTFMRKLISFIANMMFRFVFDIKVLTLSSFYRVYTIQILRQMKNKYQDIIKEKGFVCMLEVLIKAIKVDAKIIEVPMILYSEKRKGKSKMKILKTTIAYLKFLVKNIK